MMREFLVRVAITASVSALALAPPAAGAVQEETVTLAGCVQAGQNDGDFNLVVDDKQTYRIQAPKELEVASHLNHRVELTGVVEKNDTGAILKASSLKMVANSCDTRE